jgi:thioredoxin-like negative regulator of GroEL
LIQALTRDLSPRHSLPSVTPHCTQLSDKYDGHKSILIADVDCTQEKDLCGKFGVSGYPTIKYFTTATGAQGDKYEGGRDYAALEKFADESLGPSCGPGLEDLCSEEQVRHAHARSAFNQTLLFTRTHLTHAHCKFDGASASRAHAFVTIHMQALTPSEHRAFIIQYSSTRTH